MGRSTLISLNTTQAHIQTPSRMNKLLMLAFLVALMGLMATAAPQDEVEELELEDMAEDEAMEDVVESRFDDEQRSDEPDQPGHPPQWLRGQGQDGLRHGEHAPPQHDRGVGLRQLDGDVQGHGGQVSDNEGQRDRGVLMLEQRQLHRPCYNNQGLQDQQRSEVGDRPAEQLQGKLLCLQTGRGRRYEGDVLVLDIKGGLAGLRQNPLSKLRRS